MIQARITHDQKPAYVSWGQDRRYLGELQSFHPAWMHARWQLSVQRALVADTTPQDSAWLHEMHMGAHLDARGSAVGDEVDAGV